MCRQQRGDNARMKNSWLLTFDVTNDEARQLTWRKWIQKPTKMRHTAGDRKLIKTSKRARPIKAENVKKWKWMNNLRGKIRRRRRKRERERKEFAPHEDKRTHNFHWRPRRWQFQNCVDGDEFAFCDDRTQLVPVARLPCFILLIFICLPVRIVWLFFFFLGRPKCKATKKTVNCAINQSTFPNDLG